MLQRPTNKRLQVVMYRTVVASNMINRKCVISRAYFQMQMQLYAISICRQNFCLILLQMHYSAIFCNHLQFTYNNLQFLNSNRV